MAGKKKKTASNPARGFATTSVASKAKITKLEEPEKQNVLKLDENLPSLASSGHVNESVQNKEIHQMSPEELERELEKNDLQLLVDALNPKVRKESSRQISRVQTDRRSLRSQAQELNLKDWMPDHLVYQVIDLAQMDILKLNNAAEQGKYLKLSSEEDFIGRLWTLQEILAKLDFNAERIQHLLSAFISNPPAEDSSGQFWGFQNALDVLAVECSEEELPPYEIDRLKPSALSSQTTPVMSPLQSASATPKRGISPARTDGSNSSVAVGASVSTSFNSSEDDFTVSDLESDLDPEDLILTYLSTKSRLYSLRPDLVDELGAKIRGSKHSRQGKKQVEDDKSLSTGILKLQKKLKQIELDVLFDAQEANSQWLQRRNQLAQETAVRRRLASTDDNQAKTPKVSIASTVPHGPVVSSEPFSLSGIPSVNVEEQSDEDDLLGPMFSNLSEEPGISSAGENGTQHPSSIGITIRDFGRFAGIHPRRVLEDACRSRDPLAKTLYKQVSQTIYSCRHSVTIFWSKDHDPCDGSPISTVTCEWQPRSTSFTMQFIACPEVTQSEGYVATAALFLIFSQSSKDEKVYLRLPSVWRGLWSEFLEARKDQSDATARETVKSIRDLIHEQLEREADEGVVLTSRFKKRIEAIYSKADDKSQASNGLEYINKSKQLVALWHAKQSSHSYQSMLRWRMVLPMFHFRDVVLQAMQTNQVMILCGETGCGKSTQLPSFILENELSNGRECQIYCTEPRRISAISLAQRVSAELGENKKDLGTSRSLVGYAIRLESHVSSTTRLIYATVGIVLRMLESESGLNEVTHLVIDEVHERSIDTDFLLVMLRSLMARRPALKVILMSATVDAERFSKYLGGAPIINVPGRTYPVKALYLEDALEITGHKPDGAYDEGDGEDDREIDTSASGKGIDISTLGHYSLQTRSVLAGYDEYRMDYALIIKLIETVAYDPAYVPFSNAVLVFVPGIAEIRQLNDMLVGHPSFEHGWQIYPLHSTIASEDQQQAFVVPPPGIRKIVIATNIAETGITIPDIVCVIDTGRHKEMRYDERRHISRLIQSFVSRANAKQRRGRAGRVQEGICFHLFTKYRHDNLMADQQTPEMLRLSLQELVMRVKICQLGDIEETLGQALDPPSSKNIRRAIDALIEVGALTTKEELTPLGRQLSKLPLDAQLGKLCLLASIFGCLDTALTIAAILSSKDPFSTPFGARKQAEVARLSFKKGESDVLTAYNAYSTWRRVCTTPGQNEFHFCRTNYLSPQNLAGIEDLKSQLLSNLVEAGFVTLSAEERTALSRYRYASRHRTFVPVPAANNANNDSDLWNSSVLACAFYPKLLVRDGKGWRNVANNASISLHPASVMKGDMSAKYLSYYSIMQSSSRSPQAHSTTALPSPMPLVLLVGDADFKVHAGVVTLDNGRLRLKLRTWKSTVALKLLRKSAREIVDWHLTQPGKSLTPRLAKWMELLERMFVREQK